MMNTSDPLAPATEEMAVAATLYCRPTTTTASAIGRYSDRLEQLRARNIVEDVDIQEWSPRVEFDGPAETATARIYERLTTWAEEAGVELAPAFSIRTNESTFTGETHRYLVTPIACLTLVADDELLAVYPHAVKGDVYTLEDGLALLAASDRGTPVAHGHDPDPIVAEE